MLKISGLLCQQKRVESYVCIVRLKKPVRKRRTVYNSNHMTFYEQQIIQIAHKPYRKVEPLIKVNSENYLVGRGELIGMHFIVSLPTHCSEYMKQYQ